MAGLLFRRDSQRVVNPSKSVCLATATAAGTQEVGSMNAREDALKCADEQVDCRVEQVQAATSVREASTAMPRCGISPRRQRMERAILHPSRLGENMEGRLVSPQRAPVSDKRGQRVLLTEQQMESIVLAVQREVQVQMLRVNAHNRELFAGTEQKHEKLAEDTRHNREQVTAMQSMLDDVICQVEDLKRDSRSATDAIRPHVGPTVSAWLNENEALESSTQDHHDMCARIVHLAPGEQQCSVGASILHTRSDRNADEQAFATSASQFHNVKKRNMRAQQTDLSLVTKIVSEIEDMRAALQDDRTERYNAHLKVVALVDTSLESSMKQVKEMLDEEEARWRIKFQSWENQCGLMMSTAIKSLVHLKERAQRQNFDRLPGVPEDTDLVEPSDTRAYRSPSDWSDDMDLAASMSGGYTVGPCEGEPAAEYPFSTGRGREVEVPVL